MPRKTSNSSGLNLAAQGQAQGQLPGLQRSSTAPTISLQQRMEKLKEKQTAMPDPDELLKARRAGTTTGTGGLKKSPSGLFGSAPNLAGLAVAQDTREERRRRRSNSKGRKTRISRTTSAGRMHDDKELPALVDLSEKKIALKRSCTDTGVYVQLVAKMELKDKKDKAKGGKKGGKGPGPQAFTKLPKHVGGSRGKRAGTQR